MIWPGDAANDVARATATSRSTRPTRSAPAWCSSPDRPRSSCPSTSRARPCVGVAALWAGDVDEGAEAVQPFRDLAPEVDLVGPMPYADFQCMIDDPPGMHNYWSADYHDEFPDDALDVFVKYGFETAVTDRAAAAAAVGRRHRPRAEDATPMTKRDVPLDLPPVRGVGARGRRRQEHRVGQAFRRDIAHYASGGVYLNFIGDEGDDRVRAAFGDEKYPRLAGIKGEWDPDNVFRGNQNIKPA